MKFVRFVLLAICVALFLATTSFTTPVHGVPHQNVCKVRQVMNTTSHYEVFDCIVEANVIDVEFVFRPFSIIESIYFNRSQVKIVPQNFFATFELLRTCNLSMTGLEVLHRGTFKQAKILASLDLYGNEIKELTNHVFEGAQSLQILNLTLNGLERVEKDAFHGLYVLRHLILANNEIDMLEGTLLDDLGELIKLNLSGNRISIIPEGFFDLNGNLKVLDLSNNRLQHFNVYVPVNRLCYLSLDGNKVDELILHLNETVANECDVSSGSNTIASTSPIIVTANGNNIRKLVLPKFFALDVLSLNGNQISDVQNVTQVAKLRQLYLAYNPIDIVAIQRITNHLTNLRHLSLAAVHINQLDFRIFANLTNLIELDVSSNHLPSLDLTDVTSLQGLHKLNISNNRLRHIDYDYLRQHFPQLKVIDINQNDFGCDILRDMLHNSFKRQRINAIPRPGQLQIKNQPNVDGISCLQELNTGHLELFKTHIDSLLFDIKAQLNIFPPELNHLKETQIQSMTKTNSAIQTLEERFHALEERLSKLSNQTEKVMEKIIKLLDGE